MTLLRSRISFLKRVAYSVLLGVCLVLVLVSIMFSVSLLPFDLVFISLLVVFLFSCVCLINSLIN